MSNLLHEQLTPAESNQQVFDELVGLFADEPSPDTTQQFFSALSATFEDANARQDIQQIQLMAMTLGAMACLHPHMQDTANAFADQYIPSAEETNDEQATKPSHLDDDEEIDPKTGKKRKKRR